MFATQLKSVQAAREDFEWYPTTAEIITAMIEDLGREDADHGYRRHRLSRFLDIGAGDGKVLRAVEAFDDEIGLRAIEKSRTLSHLLPESAMLLGVDFWKTSLLDKNVDIIFSNPPYSEYRPWTLKILREAPAGALIYLVLPERWQDHREIAAELDDRAKSTDVIGRFDFRDAEDRRARVTAALVRIKLINCHDGGGNDPFVRFFDETFDFPDPEPDSDPDEEEQIDKLVRRTNLVEALCQLHDTRLRELHESHQAICRVPRDVLEEFDITRSGVIASLRDKLATTKKHYWRRLFDGMEELYSRLTVESRERMVNLLQSRTGIDFNRENAYTVILWAVEHANEYFDQQLIDTYETLVCAANVESYVSNHRVFSRDRFAYHFVRDENNTHYRLKVGHRIVVERGGGLNRSEWTRHVELDRRAANLLLDLATVASNLGYHVHSSSLVRDIRTIDDSTPFECVHVRHGEARVLYRVRAFLKGTLHFQFDPEFIHALNIQHGKLKGWLRNDAEAAAELEIDPGLAARFFHTSPRISADNLRITGTAEPEQESAPEPAQPSFL